MEARTLLVALVLLFSLVALGGGAAERCAQPGALRCEEGRHQSVCLERSRVWHRVRDCAASGGFCVDGRCVTKRRDQDNDNDECTPGTEDCTDDCLGVRVCLDSNTWYSYNCEKDKFCDVTPTGATCVPSSQSTCVKTFECTLTGNIPDLTNPSIYYDCSESEGNAVRRFCANDEGFSACSGTCDAEVDVIPDYPTCQRSGQSFAIPTNPSLYMVCIGTTAIWDKCETGYYESKTGKCTGSSVNCDNCKPGGDEDNVSDSSASGSTSTPTPTATPTATPTSTPTPTTTTTELPATPDPSACLGPTDRIADPTDPCWYYYCLQSGELERRRCDSGTIFVTLYRKCVTAAGSCT